MHILKGFGLAEVCVAFGSYSPLYATLILPDGREIPNTVVKIHGIFEGFEINPNDFVIEASYELDARTPCRKAFLLENDIRSAKETTIVKDYGVSVAAIPGS